jgi:hypothetical protein
MILCISHTTHTGSRGITLLFHGLEGGHRSELCPGRFYSGKDPVTIVQEAGWAPGPVWTSAEYLAPTGFRSPDRPARSQSLYRLSYLAHINKKEQGIKLRFLYET